MKLVLILSILAVASAASIGSEKCTWGPAYWCDHPLKAKECGEGATSYCIANDWAQLKVDDDSACDDCKTFITAVKNVLNNGTIQTEIISVVKELCNLLGSSEATACKLVVDMYGMDFLEALITDLDASKVCMLLELCKTDTANDVIKGPYMVHLSEVDPDPCAVCEQIFADIDDILSNTTVQQPILQELIMLCEQAGAPADLCKTYINEYGPQVFKYIVELLNGDEICTELHVCTSVLRVDFLKKVSRLQGDPCTDCKQIFSDLVDLLSNSAVVDEFAQQEVLNICLIMGLPNDVCQEMSKYTPVFMKYLASFLDGDKLCSELGLCVSTGTFSLKQSVLKLGKVSKLSGDPCTDCKQIFSDLDSILSNTSFQQYVEKEFLQMCDGVGLPSAICQDIAQYIPEALGYLVGILDGDTLCSELGVCSASGSFNPKQVSMNLNKASMANGDACTECLAIFTDLQDILNNKTVQTNLLSSLINLCEAFGIPASTCSSAVTQFEPLALKYLIPLLKGDTICPQEHLCGAGSLSHDVSSIGKSNGDTCAECKEIVMDVSDILNNQSVQSMIFSEAIAVCVALGGSSTACTSEVDDFGPIIINVLTGELTPSVCTPTQLCTPSPGVIQPRSDAEGVVAPPSNGDVCTECKQMIADLKDILSNTTVQSRIFNTLTNVCTALGVPVDTCKQGTMQLGPTVLQIITAELDGTVLCPELQLCAPGVMTKLIDAVLAFKKIAISADGDTCSECKEIVMDLSDILNNQTVQNNVFKQLIAVCTALGLPSATCSEISSFGPLVLQAVRGYLTPSLCTSEKLCSAAFPELVYLPKQMPVLELVPAQPVFNPVSNETTNCVMCEYLLDALQAMYPTGATPAQLETAMYKICPNLTVKQSVKQCNAFVTNWADRLIEELKELDFNYDKACVGLNLCPAVSELRVQMDPSTCIICEFVIDILTTFLPQDFTKEDIQSAMNRACSFLPPEYKSVCGSFVQQYGEHIIDLLLSKTPFQDICRALKVCPLVSLAQPPHNRVGSDVECTVCKYAMDLLEEFLKRNVTTTDVEHFLENICAILPSQYTTECNLFVKEYVPEILELVATFPPSRICQLIHLCTSPNASVAQTKQVRVGSPVECDVCDEVMKLLEVFLQENRTTADIEKFLDNICTVLPEAFKTQCISFMNEYIVQIVKLLDQYPPDQICKLLGLCTSAKASVAQTKQVWVGSPVECDVCDEVMKLLEVFLRENRTTADIEKFLDNICTVLPEAFKTQCISFMNEYIVQIVKLLDQYPPDQICKLLGLCTSAKASVAQTKQVRVGSPVECDVCDEVMKLLEVFLRENRTTADIEKFLDNICTVLPEAFKTQCISFMNEYIVQIVKLLDQYPPNQICKLLGLCTSAKASVAQTKQVRVGSPVECDVCDEVMKLLEVFLRENRTTADIEKFLDNICTVLPEAFKTQCISFMNEYIVQIVKLLDQYPPDQICKLLGLCTSAKVEAKVPEAVGGIACGPCMMVAEHVDIFLKEGSSQKEIEKFLKMEVCSKLPGQAQTECISVVDKYLPELLTMIASMTPQELCGLLGLCSSGDAMDKRLDAAIDSTAECMICEVVVKEMRTALSQNATEAEIQKFLDTVCSKVPLSTMAKGCQLFVDDYTRPIIQYLLAKMDPDKICDFLNICDPSKITSPMGSVNSDTLCAVCDILFGMLETQLATNKTFDEVTDFVEQVCPLLPETLNQQCKGFLDLYGPVLLKLIVDSELSPNDICKDLGLCTSSSLWQPRLAFTSAASDECVACKELVTVAEDLAKANAHAILDLVAKVCDLLPQSDQQECQNYISVYGPYVLDLLLEEYLTPDAVCTYLKLCNETMTNLPPANKCILGPAFWCASMDNAKLCNTVDHCRRHAWK